MSINGAEGIQQQENPQAEQQVTHQSSPERNMALELDIDPLKYIASLPEFNGKGNDLFTFLDLVDEISPTIAQYSASSQSILLNRIKSKLSGRAREIVEINNHLKTWSKIKKLLIDNFGDKRSSLQIFDELRSVTFTTNCIDFYNHINSILRRLNNKVKNETNSEILIKSNIQTALKIFKDKVPEPLRSILFSRDPDTLESALDILVEGNYAYYNPYKNNSTHSRFKHSRSNEQNRINPHRNYTQNQIRLTDNRSNPRRDSFNRQQNNMGPQQRYHQQNHSPRSFQYGRPNQHFNHSYQNNNGNNRNNANNSPEPMEVDRSTNSRIHTVETENQAENFLSLASEDNNFLI